MHLMCLGISHHTADLAERERFALDTAQVEQLLQRINHDWPAAEVAIVSTCNRLEIYTARPLHGHPRSEQLIDLLAEWTAMDRDTLARHVYVHQHREAVMHLFSVACGMQSMVLGENQIVAQIKQAYETAKRLRTVGPILHRVFQSALKISKQVRTQTGIGEGRISIATVALQLLDRLFDDLSRKRVLLIGVGPMIKLTLSYFTQQSVGRIMLCNRSTDRARELAGPYPVEVVDFDHLHEHLTAADVVISCTASREVLVDASAAKQIMRRRRHQPMCIIDLAVPRDFDPAIQQLGAFYLYDLDDVQQIASDNQAQREADLQSCRAIMQPRADALFAEIQYADLGSLVRQLREQLMSMADDENDRTQRKLQIASDDPQRREQLIEEHTHRLINKFLHKPLSELSRDDGSRAVVYASTLRRLFDLPQQGSDTESGDFTSTDDATAGDSEAHVDMGIGDVGVEEVKPSVSQPRSRDEQS